MSPFLDIAVHPSYGRKQAVVRWHLASGFEDADVYVYRSMTGSPPWELLNEVPTREFELLDDNLVVSNRSDNPHYRLLIEHEGKEYDSVVVGVYDRLTRDEQAGCRRIMQLELQRMMSGNGLPVLLFKPLRSGIPCPTFDNDTDQMTGTDCTDPTGADCDCYGMPYVGGFSTPVATWIEILKTAPIFVDYSAGLGASDDAQANSMRMLSFPLPRKGDMIVDPKTDCRWLVDVVDVHAFKGTVPVATTVSTFFLNRADARYRLPLPYTT